MNENVLLNLRNEFEKIKRVNPLGIEQIKIVNHIIDKTVECGFNNEVWIYDSNDDLFDKNITCIFGCVRGLVDLGVIERKSPDYCHGKYYTLSNRFFKRCKIYDQEKLNNELNKSVVELGLYVSEIELMKSLFRDFKCSALPIEIDYSITDSDDFRMLMKHNLVEYCSFNHRTYYKSGKTFLNNSHSHYIIGSKYHDCIIK
ncbi:MAG: hypothetical protein ACRCX4_04760 [Bacteroidales bacterium]